MPLGRGGEVVRKRFGRWPNIRRPEEGKGGDVGAIGVAPDGGSPRLSPVVLS